MAYLAQPHIASQEIQQQLSVFAQDALNWIVGLNPYDMCMLDGHGRNNPDYLPQYGFFNAKGGVCNGITGGFEDEEDIAFNPPAQKTTCYKTGAGANNGSRMALGTYSR